MIGNPTRRSFIASTAAAAVALGASKGKLGLELYSVRNEFKQDPDETVRRVAKMGYPGVEFFSSYYEWTPARAKEMRKLLDSLNVKCFSTHNSAKSFEPEGIGHLIELNQILGSKYIIMASAGKIADLDGWKKVAEKLTEANAKMKSSGMRPGFHNHKLEFLAIGDKRPMDVLAKETPKDVVLQLDVGTCIDAKQDPVAWINSNPGRIRSVHCKDFDPNGKGYRVIFGEGAAPWKEIFAAAEKTGGVEHFLIEQEGADESPFDVAQKCYDNYKKLRAS